MKVGDLVRHIDMPKAHRILGIVVETYVDLDTCDVIWTDKGCEVFQHYTFSLELVIESR
jgi:hypothetical protein